MDEKIAQFLEDAVYDADTKLYNSMVDDAEKLDTKSFIDKYQPEIEKHNELALAWKSYGLDKYGKDKWVRYREAFGSSDKDNPFNKDEAWLQATWQNEFSDIPYEQYKKDIETNKQFWEDEKRAREYEASKVKRAREIKEAGPFSKWTLASDYSKQRYINEPEKSIFSKEGEWYNKGEDISDVSLGALGLAGDLVPGYGVVLGPAARAVRDVRHKAEDSPYQKDWKDIARDAGVDVVTNAGVQYLPTAILRRGNRYGKAISKTDEVLTNVKDVAALNERALANKAAYDSFTKNLDKFKDVRKAEQYVKILPESDVKADLLAMIKSPEYSEAAVKRYAEAFAKAEKEGIDAFKQFEKTGIARRNPNAKTEDLGKESVDYFTTKEQLAGLEPSKKRAAAAWAVSKAQPVGEGAVKAGYTYAGRGSEPEVDTKLAKDWYKQNYARDWALGFKPNEKEGDPLWEAYKEWYNEHKGK